MKPDQFITRLAAMGNLQRHHVKTTAWLSELPLASPVWRELDAAWRIVLKYQRTGVRVDMRKFVTDPIIAQGTVPIDDNNLGLYREALNAAFQIMQRQSAQKSIFTVLEPAGAA